MVLPENLDMELYENVRNKNRDAVYVSVGSKGRIGLSSGFMEKYYSGSQQKYAFITRKVIGDILYVGIGLTNEQVSNSVKINYPRKKGGYGIIQSENLYNDYKQFFDELRGFRYKPEIFQDKKVNQKTFVISKKSDKV